MCTNCHSFPLATNDLATKTFMLCVLLLLGASPTINADTFGTGGNQFTIDFVTIGNPGNPADTTGNPNPAGSVPYVYRMGKYEISREMVDKANNSAGLGITQAFLTIVTGGPRPSMPASSISWNEAARFVNWLNTSQGFPAAYKFATQPGDPGYSANSNILLWQPGDPGYNPENPFRNNLSHFFLPSVHEWYKAAFYDPNANGGAGGYWDYATGSDSRPTGVANGTTAGTAVWGQLSAQGPADIMLAGGLSPYGTMAQDGNVSEWEETEFDLVNDAPSSVRAIRGPYWSSSYGRSPSSSSRYDVGGGATPTYENGTNGFRVASIAEVPEPSTLLFVAFAWLTLLSQRRRTRYRITYAGLATTH